MGTLTAIFVGLLFIFALDKHSFAMKSPTDCIDVAEVCSIKGPDTRFFDECGRLVRCVGGEDYYELKEFGIRRNLTDEPVWTRLMSRFHASPKRTREACSASVTYLFNFKKKAYNRFCENKKKELYGNDGE